MMSELELTVEEKSFVENLKENASPPFLIASLYFTINFKMHCTADIHFII